MVDPYRPRMHPLLSNPLERTRRMSEEEWCTLLERQRRSVKRIASRRRKKLEVRQELTVDSLHSWLFPRGESSRNADAIGQSNGPLSPLESPSFSLLTTTYAHRRT